MKLVVEWTGPEELRKTLRPFLDLTAETTKQLKHVIERKYVGKLKLADRLHRTRANPWRSSSD